jgi:hypothetical protein
MTSFIDGPAKGQCLLLKRSPQLLRVVELNGKWDALDQPGDEPRPGEKVYDYELAGQSGTCHINAGRRSGFYPISKYRVAPKQKGPNEERSHDPDI